MNDALSWLYQQYHEERAESGAEQCYLCGAACSSQHSVARGLPDSFNSHYLAHCPQSSWLCSACAWYLDGRAGHPEFRKMSLIVMQHAWLDWPRAAMKGDIERWLAQGLTHDAYLVVSLTKKKHVLLQAPVNSAGSCLLAVQIEEQIAYLDAQSWEAVDIPFMRLVALGHGRGEILSGRLYSSTLRKHGRIREVMMLSESLAHWRSSPLLSLYSYVTLIDKEGA